MYLNPYSTRPNLLFFAPLPNIDYMNDRGWRGACDSRVAIRVWYSLVLGARAMDCFRAGNGSSARGQRPLDVFVERR